MEYAAMLDALSVRGDSMTAIENARKVLDAETAADRAVMDAKAALQAARDAKAKSKAKAKAEALPSDHRNRGSLIAALDAAIGYAEERVEAAREQAGSMALDAAVTAVRGTDTNNPMGPVSHGEAAAVGGALGRALTWLGFSPQISLVQEQRSSNAQLHDYERIFGELQFVRLF